MDVCIWSVLQKIHKRTDNNVCAHLKAFERFCDDIELNFCNPIKQRATSTALFTAWIILLTKQILNGKISKQANTIKTKIFRLYLEKLRDAQRITGIKRNDY